MESFSVELRAQPQILDVMTTSLRSGILSIGFHPDFKVKTDISGIGNATAVDK